MVVRKRTDYTRKKVPRNICSRERKFRGTLVPRSKSSREFLFLGVKVPTGNIHSEEQKYRGTKSPLGQYPQNASHREEALATKKVRFHHLYRMTETNADAQAVCVSILLL